MTTSKTASASKIEEVFLRANLHDKLRNTPDVMLDIDTTAFFLGIHKKKLERWRTERRPPHPTLLNADSRSGVRVQYRVGALLDFIRDSQVQPGSASSTQGISVHKVVNGKREKPDTMVWLAEDVLNVDAIEEPFFISDDGLVLAHGWEDDVTTIAERLMSRQGVISWMTWDNALAGVWLDESCRLNWLAHADSVSPGLRAAVDLKRQAHLAKR
jgi:hypothetical protein